MSCLLWGCGSTRNLAAWEAARSRASRPPEGRSFAGAKFVNAPALQAVSCGSVTRHLQCCARQYFHRELLRIADCKSAVTKRVGRRPVEHYHQLPPFITPTPWVPKPKSSRRTVVNRVINECKSRRDRHGSNLPQARGRQLIRSAWNREIPGAAPGCLTTFPPCSSGVERVTSNRTVAGAIPAGEISQVSK